MTTPPVNLTEAGRRIAAEPAPVLFIDTCALLDIVRLPLRLKAPVAGRNAVAAARAVAALEADERTLWAVVPPPVLEEYRRNAPGVLEELTGRWRRLDDEYRGTHDVAQSLGVGVPTPPLFEANLGAFRRRLEELPERVIERAVRLGPDDGARLRAMTRAETAVAPSQRGKESLADCVLTEHVLGLADVLGDRAPRPLVLLSSNTDDFYDGGGTLPRPPLNEQFGTRGIKLVRTWEWAAAELGV